MRGVAVRTGELFPITPLGLALAAVATVALRRYAFAQLDLVLLALGYGALGLLVVATVLVVLASSALAYRFRRPPVRERLGLETARFVDSGFDAPSLRFVPLIGVRLTVVSPGGVETRYLARRGRLVESLRVSSRGEHEAIVRTLSVSDVFGLARVTLRLVDRSGLRAVPHVGGLKSLPTLRSLSSGDAYSHPLGVDEGDRMDLRRYAPGDPARLIHWKAYARTGKLVVRVPERAIAPSRRVVAYFVAGEGDEASAGAARAAVESQAFGADWIFGADGTAGAVRTPPEVVDLLVRSASARVEGGAGLRRFLEDADREGPATVVLFVPARPGPFLDAVLEVARARRAPVRVVIGVDGLVPEERGSLVRRLFLAPPARHGEALASLLRVREALVAARAEVLVVDRGSGRLLAAAGTPTATLVALAGRAA